MAEPEVNRLIIVNGSDRDFLDFVFPVGRIMWLCPTGTKKFLRQGTLSCVDDAILEIIAVSLDCCIYDYLSSFMHFLCK